MESSDVLLDIDEYELAHAAASDDFVLDLDMPDEAFEDTLGGEVSSPAPMRRLLNRKSRNCRERCRTCVLL